MCVNIFRNSYVFQNNTVFRPGWIEFLLFLYIHLRILIFTVWPYMHATRVSLTYTLALYHLPCNCHVFKLLKRTICRVNWPRCARFSSYWRPCFPDLWNFFNIRWRNAMSCQLARARKVRANHVKAPSTYTQSTKQTAFPKRANTSQRALGGTKSLFEMKLGEVKTASVEKA